MVALLKSSLMLEGSGADSSVEDVTEGARRATVETSSRASPPEPEVEPIARRRRFSGSEKRRLLAEAERCKAKGPGAHRTGPTVARRNGPSPCAVTLECAVVAGPGMTNSRVRHDG